MRQKATSRFVDCTEEKDFLTVEDEVSAVAREKRRTEPIMATEAALPQTEEAFIRIESQNFRVEEFTITSYEV